MTKICKTCNVEKDMTDYPKDKYTKDGFTASCKKCRYSHTNNWARENYLINKEEILLKNTQWRNNNWEAVYIQRVKSGSQTRGMNRWYHNKGKFNVNHVLSERLRQRIRKTITKGYRSAPTMKLLGCNITTFKLHLESQFIDNMTWDNYGEWHIDHIQPCCSFDLTKNEEQHKCFHYTNQRPLWGRDNCLKSKTDKLQSIKSAVPESNESKGICNPPHDHSANGT